jgi:DNA-binding MarR family transcriptional regulator
VFYEKILEIVRKGYDFTDRQKCVLYAAQNTPQTVKGLAELLNVSKPAITRAVDRLEFEKLVERKDDPDDRRSVLIAITKPGKDFLKFVETV